MDLAQFFEAGGWPMYPILLIGMVAAPSALALPVVGWAAGKPRLALLFSMLLAVLGLLAAGMGALGRAWGMASVEEALAHVNPADQEIIRMAGSSESRTCLVFGLVVAAFPLAGACVALGRALTARFAPLALAGALVLGAGLGTIVGGAALQQATLVRAEGAVAHHDPASRATAEALLVEATSRLPPGLFVGGLLAIAGAGILAAGAHLARPRPTA